MGRKLYFLELSGEQLVKLQQILRSQSTPTGLFREQKVRDVVYINILIYFVFAILSTLLHSITAVILFIYYSLMILAIHIFVKNFDQKLSNIFLSRPLILTAMVGIFYIVVNFIHILLSISHFSIGFLSGNLLIGFLLGLGYGLGNEISDRYLVK
jgi:hypothetical protein